MPTDKYLYCYLCSGGNVAVALKKETRALREGRILLVIEEAGDGGTEVYVESLAEWLSAAGLDPEIVVLSGTQDAAEARFPRHRVRAVPGIRGLAALFREGPALANMHLYSSLLPATIAARRGGVPVVATLHIPLAPWNAIHRTKWRLAIGLSSSCIGVAEDCLRGYGLLTRGKPCCVVSGPLPLEILPPARHDRAARPSGPFTVACTARLADQKDIPTLLQAFARCSGMRLVLIGDGPLRGELEALASSLGIDATFAGRLPRDAVFASVRDADAFVLPSRFEGLGIAAVEAMALGTPTVTADFPAAFEYVLPEETGLMFPSGDSAALAASLERLRDDGPLRERLSRSGAAYVRDKFTPSAQFGRYASIFEGLRRRPRTSLAPAD